MSNTVQALKGWEEIESKLPKNKILLTRKDIQEALDVCHVTASKIMNDPSFPAVTVSARKKVARPAFIEWLKCQR